MYTFTEVCAKSLIAVTQEIFRRWIPRKRLNHLLSGSLGRRMFGHVEVDNFTLFMSEHEEYIQDSKCRRRHREEVDRYQVFTMIVQKGPPRLRWWFRMMYHVLCDSRLGDVNAEYLQLAVNPRCTPANVVARHCPDKFAHLGCDGWTPTPAATVLPGLVQSKALAVPTHQGIRFEDLQCLQASRP